MNGIILFLILREYLDTEMEIHSFIHISDDFKYTYLYKKATFHIPIICIKKKLPLFELYVCIARRLEPWTLSRYTDNLAYSRYQSRWFTTLKFVSFGSFNLIDSGSALSLNPLQWSFVNLFPSSKAPHL